MDVHSVPEYQKEKENVKIVDPNGRIEPIAKLDVDSIPQYQKANTDAVDYYVPNYLGKLSLSDEHKQMENLYDVDDLEERLQETRRAQSILISMYGFTPADFLDIDEKLFDEDRRRSAMEEKVWRESNTRTSCGYLNWDCWCKTNFEELRAARKAPSTPVVNTDTLFEEKDLFPWLTTPKSSSCNTFTL